MNTAPSAPRAILFDIGDTLLEERRFDLAAGIGAVVSDAEHALALARAFQAETVEQHRHDRELLLAAWLRDHVEALAGHSVAEIEDAVWSKVVTLTPRSGVLAVLDHLVADGIPLAAISNAAFSGRVLMSELARHGLAAPMRFVLSSADIGLRKPATGIFDAGVARLNALARDTWFVGDTWNEDVLGASQAGLQPLWLRAGHTEATSVPILRDWEAFMDHYAAARCRAPAG